MKRVWTVLFALTVFAPASTEAATIPVADVLPALIVCANDDCRNLSESIRRSEDGKSYFFDKLVAEFPTANVTVSGFYETDPFISFGATTTNLVAGPTTFAFLFGTPITPGFYNKATSTAGVTVTNGVGGTTTVATSLVYPTYLSGYGTLGLVPTNLGVDLGTLPCIAGPGVPFTVTTVCAQGTTSNTFALTSYDNLEALLTYTQNDVASVASWSGAVTLTTVPEPTLLTLFGVALFGVRRRLRR